jgi:predicted signal transduction protein with EAL and GGDEF domain
MDRLAQTLAVAQRDVARRVVWVDGETNRAGRTAAQLEADLLHAIDKGEIEVHYQPQFALDEDGNEHLSGAEALARWNHPKLGRIGAAALFAIADRADHLAPLSRHIAETALKAASAWPGICACRSTSQPPILRRAALPSIWARRWARPAFPPTG